MTKRGEDAYQEALWVASENARFMKEIGVVPLSTRSYGEGGVYRTYVEDCAGKHVLISSIKRGKLKFALTDAGDEADWFTDPYGPQPLK